MIVLGIFADRTACVGTVRHQSVQFDDQTCDVQIIVDCPGEERVLTRLATTCLFCDLLYFEGSSTEYKHVCDRKSCGMPFAIENVDHDPSSAMRVHETVTHECHSGDSLDGELNGNRRLKVDPWWSLPLLASTSLGALVTRSQAETPRRNRSTECRLKAKSSFRLW